MFDRLVERFCEFDDFCQKIRAEWEAYLVADGRAPERKHGPEAGLCDSEIMTLVVLYHRSQFKNFKTLYNGIVLTLMRPYFRNAPCYERFIPLTKLVWPMLALFLASRMGQKPTSITSIVPLSLSVTTGGSPNTGFSRVWPPGEKPAWAGSSASSCIWCSIIGARLSRLN